MHILNRSLGSIIALMGCGGRQTLRLPRSLPSTELRAPAKARRRRGTSFSNSSSSFTRLKSTSWVTNSVASNVLPIIYLFCRLSLSRVGFSHCLTFIIITALTSCTLAVIFFKRFLCNDTGWMIKRPLILPVKEEKNKFSESYLPDERSAVGVNLQGGIQAFGMPISLLKCPPVYFAVAVSPQRACTSRPPSQSSNVQGFH